MAAKKKPVAEPAEASAKKKLAKAGAKEKYPPGLIEALTRAMMGSLADTGDDASEEQ
jgi:hypothetical protein